MEPNYVYVMRLNDRAHKIGISVDPGRRSLQLSYLHRQPVRVVYTWLREAGDKTWTIETFTRWMAVPPPPSLTGASQK